MAARHQLWQEPHRYSRSGILGSAEYVSVAAGFCRPAARRELCFIRGSDKGQIEGIEYISSLGDLVQLFMTQS